MSNYYCPRCGKTIIDIPGGQSYHTCTPNNDRLDTRNGYNNSLDSEHSK